MNIEDYDIPGRVVTPTTPIKVIMKYIHIYGSQSSLLRFFPFRGGYISGLQNKNDDLLIEHVARGRDIDWGMTGVPNANNWTIQTIQLRRELSPYRRK